MKAAVARVLALSGRVERIAEGAIAVPAFEAGPAVAADGRVVWTWKRP